MEKLSDKYKSNNNDGSKPQSQQKPSLSPANNNGSKALVQKKSAALPYSSENLFLPRPTYLIDINDTRQANISVVAGCTGVGKSHYVIQEVRATLMAGRPAIIFDVNFEPEYKQAFPRVISVKQIKNLVNPECVRILPVNPDGSKMSKHQKQMLCIEMSEKAFNMLLVYDDYDKYCSGSSKTQDMSAIFTSNRHQGQDMIFVHQSLRRISTHELDNAWMLRLHKTNQSVDIIEDRFSNYDIVKLSELVVWEQFYLTESLYQRGKINKIEWQKRRSFFVYIDLRRDKIISKFSKECWIRNCKKFLRLHPNRIKEYANLYLKGNDSNEDMIMEKIIENDFSRYYTPPSPFQ